MIPFGQLDVAVHTFLDVVDYAPQVTSACIGRNHNLPFHVLPVDRVRSHGGHHVGYVQQRHLVPFGVVYHQVLDTVHRTPVIFARTDYQIESLSLFIDLRHHFAGHVYLYEFIELRQGDTILRQHLPFRDNFQLRALYLLFHVQVGDTFHIGYRVLYLVSEGEHPVQVIAEQLDGDTGLRTAQHGVDTVADGLADFDVGSGQHREFPAYFGQQFGVRAVLQLERRFNFRYIHAQRMLVQFRTSCLAGHGLDFGDGKQQLFGLAPDFIGFLQRNARQGADVDGKRTLVERRQEAVSQGEETPYGHHKQGKGTAQYPTLVRQGPSQRLLVMLLQPYGHEGLLRQTFFPVVPSQQVATEYRSQCQGHYGRGEQGNDEGDAQRNQHTPFHTAQEKQRYEADYNNQGGIQNRHTHLARSVEHHFTDGLSATFRQHAVLAQVFPHILHIDDGIVYQRTDGDGHTSQTHGIDAQSHVVKHQDGHHKRERQGYQRDERGPCIGQEEEQYNHHKERPFVQGGLYIADGAFDEAGLAENIGRDVHIGRQVLLQILQGRFQAFGQLDGTRIGLFGYGDQHRRFPLLRGQSQLRLLGADFHIGYIFQHHRYPVHPLDDRPAHFTYIVGGKYATHDVLVAVFVNHPAVGVLVHVAGNFHHFAQRHTVMFHAFGMQQYLIFFDVASQNGHLRYAAGREQARTDGPVGQGT